MVFAFAGEHSPNTPVYKGYRVYALNATTGDDVWNLLDWSASGLGTSLGKHRHRRWIHGLPKTAREQVTPLGRPSATSIQSQNNVVSRGNTVLIEEKSPIQPQAPNNKNRQHASPAASQQYQTVANPTSWHTSTNSKQCQPTQSEFRFSHRCN